MKHRISAVGLGTVNWLTRQRCKIFCLRAAIWRSLTILEILRIHAPSSTCQLNRGTHRSLNTKGSSQPLYQAVYSTNPHWQESTRAPQSEIRSPVTCLGNALWNMLYISLKSKGRGGFVTCIRFSGELLSIMLIAFEVSQHPCVLAENWKGLMFLI